MHLVPLDKIPNKAEELPDNLLEIYSICLQMREICNKENGIGLSAFQVGIPWKLFIIKDESEEGYSYYLDCEYEPVKDEKISSIEGCLSIQSNGILPRYKVSRYKNVRVIGKKLCLPDLKLESVNFVPDFGVVFQHEIDHHNGILISQIGELMDVW